jgi:hypothetical protein
MESRGNEKTINLRLYDLDDSLYWESEEERQLKIDNRIAPPFNDWFFSRNKDFLNANLQDINRHQYQKVIVGFGTNRINTDIDLLNCDKQKTFLRIPALPFIQNYFEKNTLSEVVFDPSSGKDLSADHPAGSALEKTITTVEFYGVKKGAWDYISLKPVPLNTENGFDTDGISISDEDKIALIYAHAHRVANLYPADNIVLDFYDDNADILEKIFTFFYKNPDLLPHNVLLNLPHQYKDGQLYDDPKFHSIQGTGESDQKYHRTIQHIEHLYASEIKNTEGNLGGIKSSEIKNLGTKLKKFRSEDQYQKLILSQQIYTAGYQTATDFYQKHQIDTKPLLASDAITPNLAAVIQSFKEIYHQNKDEQTASFISALETLHAKIDKKIPKSKIEKSQAFKLKIATNGLLQTMIQNKGQINEVALNQAILLKYAEKTTQICRQNMLTNFFKAAAAVVVAGLAMVAGMALAVGIGAAVAAADPSVLLDLPEAVSFIGTHTG